MASNSVTGGFRCDFCHHKFKSSIKFPSRKILELHMKSHGTEKFVPMEVKCEEFSITEKKKKVEGNLVYSEKVQVTTEYDDLEKSNVTLVKDEKSNVIIEDDISMKFSEPNSTPLNNIKIKGEKLKKFRSKKGVVCVICDREFQRNDHLLRHTETQHAAPISCNDCHTSFKVKSALRRHRKITKCRRSFFCETCTKSFSTSNYLMVHKRIHTGERPYTCETCGKCFARDASFKEHTQSHNGGGRKFKCETCEKSFNTSNYLRVHRRIHTGEKPFTCDTCGKSFIQVSGLYLHHRTSHSTEVAIKPLQCADCPKSFRQKANLRNHMNIHTGERPYSCSECSSSFKQPQAMKRHLKIHTGEKTFSCSSCPKKFITKSDLMRHSTSHTGERNFPCNVCMQTFRRSSHLKRHTSNIHGIIDEQVI